MLANYISSASKQLNQIKDLAEPIRCMSDSQLRDRSMKLRFQTQAGEKLERVTAEAFALVVEAAERALGIRHYDVQILGGIHMATGKIIEMETGQGKTLTATLPLYLYALHGKGSHLATSNDYLAQRDGDTMRPLFGLLGMTTGFVSDQMRDQDRIDNYQCDITYGTSSEFGFDFLRDRMKRRRNSETRAISSKLPPVQRDLFFILADEADALLIDEANTPLVIGASGEVTEDKKALFRWASVHAPEAIENTHFKYLLRERRVELLKEGRNWARTKVKATGLRCRSILDLYEKLERAICVHRDFHRDQHYIVRDNKLVLVNETTGRLGEGREMAEGIQQAIQAAEQIEITAPTTHAAKLTTQGLFLSYDHRAGMTGTAKSAAHEFRKVYKSQVIVIPPRHPSQRKALPTKYFPNQQEKWAAICEEIVGLHREGRPVLVGTRSVATSEILSAQLSELEIPHQVLNARQHDAEAKIVAHAGEKGRVTVATSMAGRGTDIKLTDEVHSLGGLHVIVSEYHDSPRQDQQLFGRCGRQGEPGTYRQYLSADDAILDLGFGDTQASQIRNRVRGTNAALLKDAQDRLETRKRQMRMAFLHQEKRQLRSIWEMGRDPLLDTM